MKRQKRSAEFYRAALLGIADAKGEVSPGLRRTAKGFAAADGFNLRDLKAGKWTPAMKRKATMYHAALQEMTAQNKVIIHTRSPDRLQKAQAIGGHDPKFKQFKVAFVPGSKDAIVQWDVDNTPIIREPWGRQLSELFNIDAMASDPKAEVARILALEKFDAVKRFAIMTAPNVMYGEMPNRNLLFDKIRKLMLKYDGVKPLPETSGNHHGPNANPAHHKWDQWLLGLQGIEPAAPDPRGHKATQIADRISIENRKLQKRRRNAKRRMNK